MRTTLELDDELLVKAKAIAKERGETLGQVISSLANQTLSSQEPPKYRNGFRLIYNKPAGRPHTMEFVNELRDEE